MKYNTKVKIRKQILGILKSEIFYYIIIIGVVVAISILSSSIQLELFDFTTIEINGEADNEIDNKAVLILFDITVITSLITAFLIASISKYLSKFVERKLEDNTKLKTDYSNLVQKYPKCNKMIVYKNGNNSNYKKGRRRTSVKRVQNKEENDQDEYIFPVVYEKDCYNCDIIINDDNKKQYDLPDIIKQNYLDLMDAHKHSTVYNNLNIRLDDYCDNGNEIILHTSRTEYFNSLVTNRAIDYNWTSNKALSVRELYSPGPFFEELKDSVLSNHLGYNGFVETSDGKFIFILRSKDVSIGKETLGTSVGASVKSSYALDNYGKFTLNCLGEAIKLEIKDELNIDEKEMVKDGNREIIKLNYDFSLKENIIALYRDIVEGGKPQLLFYVQTRLNSDEIKEKFYKATKNVRRKKSESIKMDGKELILVDRDKLLNAYITPDTIVIGKKSYRTLPSSAASVVILINHLRGSDVILNS